MPTSMLASTTAVANKMLDFLNLWPDKPDRFRLDDLPDKAPSVMLQPLSGSRIIKKYIDGSFIGLFSFAIYYRTEMSDTKGKKDARQDLENLANWIEGQELPDLGERRKATEIQQETPPTVAVVYDDVEDLQMVYSLYYKERM